MAADATEAGQDDRSTGGPRPRVRCRPAGDPLL